MFNSFGLLVAPPVPPNTTPNSRVLYSLVYSRCHVWVRDGGRHAFTATSIMCKEWRFIVGSPNFISFTVLPVGIDNSNHTGPNITHPKVLNFHHCQRDGPHCLLLYVPILAVHLCQRDELNAQYPYLILNFIFVTTYNIWARWLNQDIDLT